MRKAKAKRAILGKVTYPAAMAAAVVYLWCTGEMHFAVIASVVGTAGTAYGWACE